MPLCLNPKYITRGVTSDFRGTQGMTKVNRQLTSEVVGVHGTELTHTPLYVQLTPSLLRQPPLLC